MAGSLYLARTINALYPKAYAVVYSDDKWPTDLSRADAIVVLLNHAGPAADDPNIKRAVERGAGFMAVHYGVEVNKGAQGSHFLDWMGGYFETFWSVNPWWTPEIKVAAKHPTARGVQPFQIRDEWYYHMRFRDGMKGVTPILSAVAPLTTISDRNHPSERGGNPDVLKAVEAGEPQILAWAYERPMPRPLPVTTATLPSSEMVMRSSCVRARREAASVPRRRARAPCSGARCGPTPHRAGGVPDATPPARGSGRTAGA